MCQISVEVPSSHFNAANRGGFRPLPSLQAATGVPCKSRDQNLWVAPPPPHPPILLLIPSPDPTSPTSLCEGPGVETVAQVGGNFPPDRF